MNNVTIFDWVYVIVSAIVVYGIIVLIYWKKSHNKIDKNNFNKRDIINYIYIALAILTATIGSLILFTGALG